MSNDKPDYYAMAEGISKTIGKVTKPLTDAQFIALAGAVAVYVEKALAHEAEKQAGPVAEPIGYLNPKVLGPDGKIAATDALTHSGVPVGGWTMPIYTALSSPLSEQDKEDAELLKWLAHAGEVSIYMLRDQPGDGDIVCDTDFGSGQAPTFRDAIRAARAKKEQP